MPDKLPAGESGRAWIGVSFCNIPAAAQPEALDPLPIGHKTFCKEKLDTAESVDKMHVVGGGPVEPAFNRVFLAVRLGVE